MIQNNFAFGQMDRCPHHGDSKGVQDLMKDSAAFWNDRSARFAALAQSPLSFYARRTALIAELVSRHARGGCAIDIGCGAGHLCVELARRGFDVYGADLSRPQITAAVQNARQLLEVPEQHFRVCEADTIPFDGCFEVITAIGVLPYVEDHPAFVARVVDRLASGGLFVASITRNVSLFTLVALVQHLRHFRLGRDWLIVFGNLARTGVWSGGFVDRRTALQCRSARSLDRLCQGLGLVPVTAVDLYNLSGEHFDGSPLARGIARRALARAFGWCHIAVYRAGNRAHARET
jgi:2-polyprenyl-3-methyl-5-hydroxy-6-metoxy-1,4-benzoquinol methylase